MDFFNTVNWKTTGLAIGYLICKVVGGLYPPIAGVCDVLEPLIVAGGLASAADAARVQNVVRAVDTVMHNIKIDPTTLAPVEPVPVVEVK